MKQLFSSVSGRKFLKFCHGKQWIVHQFLYNRISLGVSFHWNVIIVCCFNPLDSFFSFSNIFICSSFYKLKKYKWKTVNDPVFPETFLIVYLMPQPAWHFSKLSWNFFHFSEIQHWNFDSLKGILFETWNFNFLLKNTLYS